MSYTGFWIGTTALLLCLLTDTAAGEDVCTIVRGAVIVGQDGPNTFLGKIANAFDGECPCPRRLIPHTAVR